MAWGRMDIYYLGDFTWAFVVVAPDLDLVRWQADTIMVLVKDFYFLSCHCLVMASFQGTITKTVIGNDVQFFL